MAVAGSPPMNPSTWPALRAALAELTPPMAMMATSRSGSSPASFSSARSERSVPLPARVDRASHHGRGDLGPALEIHELRRDAFALEVAELLRDVEGQEDEGRRRADLDRLLRLGAVRRDEQGSKQRDRESHGKASGAGSGWGTHDLGGG